MKDAAGEEKRRNRVKRKKANVRDGWVRKKRLKKKVDEKKL